MIKPTIMSEIYFNIEWLIKYQSIKSNLMLQIGS